MHRLWLALVPLALFRRSLAEAQGLELEARTTIRIQLIIKFLRVPVDLQVWNIFDEPSEGGISRAPWSARTDTVPDLGRILSFCWK